MNTAAYTDPADTTGPAWTYRNGTLPEGETTHVGDGDTEQTDDDAPDCTPRPALSVFAQAARAARRAWGAHRAVCVRCGCGPESPCPRGAALARRAGDAQDAARGTLRA